LEDFPFAELTLEGREMVPRRVGRHRAESFGITDPQHDVNHVGCGTEMANRA